MVKHEFSLGPDSEQVCYVLCYDLNCVFQKKKKDTLTSENYNTSEWAEMKSHWNRLGP